MSQTIESESRSTVLVEIAGKSNDSGPSALELLARCLEKRLADESDAKHAALLRETMDRLKSRGNPPEKNVEDYYRIVRYLLHGRTE